MKEARASDGAEDREQYKENDAKRNSGGRKMCRGQPATKIQFAMHTHRLGPLLDLPDVLIPAHALDPRTRIDLRTMRLNIGFGACDHLLSSPLRRCNHQQSIQQKRRRAFAYLGWSCCRGEAAAAIARTAESVLVRAVRVGLDDLKAAPFLRVRASPPDPRAILPLSASARDLMMLRLTGVSASPFSR